MANGSDLANGSSKTTDIVHRLRSRLGDRERDLAGPLTERGVGREFSVSRMTARQALRRLVESGHLRVDPRRGYWPASPTRQAIAAPRIAFVNTTGDRPWGWQHHIAQMWLAIQEAVVSAGGTALAFGEPNPMSGWLASRLAGERVDGVILDCDSRQAADIVAELGIPCVLVNTPATSINADVLVQDNATGGYLAGRHLLELGHRRIGWLGWPTQSAHGRERLGGFIAALAERGLHFNPDLAAFVDVLGGDDGNEVVRRLLKARPTAMVALWVDLAATATVLIRQAGLSIPEDVSLVTWGTAENFAARWHEYCGLPDPPPDAIHWRMKDMVDAALSRLAERIRNPLSPPVQLFMPVHLECRNSCRAVDPSAEHRKGT